MEAAGETLWDAFLDDDEDAESCLAREECVRELLEDAPPGCLYCRLAELGEDDDV